MRACFMYSVRTLSNIVKGAINEKTVFEVSYYRIELLSKN
jgi:hypothetical protein